MPYADVNGLHLYYETEGDGSPLILLHGGLGTTSMFGANRTALAEHHRVIAVDLQGHGRTADIDRPIDPKLMAGDIVALIEQLRLGKTDLMGYSLGSGVALWVAILRPDLVGRLVVVSTIFRNAAFYPEIRAMQAQMTPQAAEGMKQTPMYAEYARVAPRVEDFTRVFMKLNTLMKTDLDFSKDIATIAAPVLVVQGDADIVPPSHAVELFGLLGGGQRDAGWDGSGMPKSHLAILPGLTHYDIFAAPQLAEVVIPFLEGAVAGVEDEAASSSPAHR
jgi:pimeloyl-ACP methyl ester carboxylesterase